MTIRDQPEFPSQASFGIIRRLVYGHAPSMITCIFGIPGALYVHTEVFKISEGGDFFLFLQSPRPDLLTYVWDPTQIANFNYE